MDKNHSITISAERKRGQHLGAEERGAIQALKKLGFSNRAIAREINCSPSTVGYELRRGTPVYSGRGRRPGYSAKRGTAVYKVNQRSQRFSFPTLDGRAGTNSQVVFGRLRAGRGTKETKVHSTSTPTHRAAAIRGTRDGSRTEVTDCHTSVRTGSQ